ncbi:GntR family transcriptional regulator [Sciscionella sediminilitoris]|uniref:GntR family transcriptional regulator n=1 Tax=Sciscionella sediminilitoris TaxID=1445613 RepID=UPI0004DFAB06|nr:GntR family transcriptional regulator [Sciscionella sp. SE31]
MSKQSLSARVYDQLRASIVELRLTPGQRLSENRLADRLGVSRTPIREALHRLADDRLVVRNEEGGFEVAVLSHHDVDSLCDLLEVVDAYLFGRAARLAGTRPEQAEALRGLAERMGSAAEQTDLDAWSAADSEFHQTVNTLADNEWASEVALRSRSRLHRFWLNHSARRQRLQSCSAEHVELALAVAEGDSERAATLVRGHIGHMRESLHGLLDAAAPLFGSGDWP